MAEFRVAHIAASPGSEPRHRGYSTDLAAIRERLWLLQLAQDPPFRLREWKKATSTRSHRHRRLRTHRREHAEHRQLPRLMSQVARRRNPVARSAARRSAAAGTCGISPGNQGRNTVAKRAPRPDTLGDGLESRVPQRRGWSSAEPRTISRAASRRTGLPPPSPCRWSPRHSSNPSLSGRWRHRGGLLPQRPARPAPPPHAAVGRPPGRRAGRRPERWSRLGRRLLVQHRHAVERSGRPRIRPEAWHGTHPRTPASPIPAAAPARASTPQLPDGRPGRLRAPAHPCADARRRRRRRPPGRPPRTARAPGVRAEICAHYPPTPIIRPATKPAPPRAATLDRPVLATPRGTAHRRRNRGTRTRLRRVATRGKVHVTPKRTGGDDGPRRGDIRASADRGDPPASANVVVRATSP